MCSVLVNHCFSIYPLFLLAIVFYPPRTTDSDNLFCIVRFFFFVLFEEKNAMKKQISIVITETRIYHRNKHVGYVENSVRCLMYFFKNLNIYVEIIKKKSYHPIWPFVCRHITQPISGVLFDTFSVTRSCSGKWVGGQVHTAARKMAIVRQLIRTRSSNISHQKPAQ